MSRSPVPGVPVTVSELNCVESAPALLDADPVGPVCVMAIVAVSIRAALVELVLAELVLPLNAVGGQAALEVPALEVLTEHLNVRVAPSKTEALLELAPVCARAPAGASGTTAIATSESATIARNGRPGSRPDRVVTCCAKDVAHIIRYPIVRR